MGKKKFTGKNRLDKFYCITKASEYVYRSRAAFKLLQIESKYSILTSSRAILNLCAAPGSWMQVAVNKAPVGALVVGIDLVSISPIRGAISVQEDITKPKCIATVKKLLTDNGFNAFDLILHDGSPNVADLTQTSHVIDSLKFATLFLSPNGHFVTKIFRSQDYNAVVYCLKKFFDKVEAYKHRLQPAEIYIVCLSYKAPAKIDPRDIIHIKYLFEGAAEPQKVIDVLSRGRPEIGGKGYDEKLEKILDEAYEQYVTKNGGSTTQSKRAKNAYTKEILDDIAEPDDSDKDEADQEANPLLDPIDKEAALTSADLFEEAVEQGDLGKDERDDMVKNVPKHKILQKKTGKVEDELEGVPAPCNSSDSSSSDDDSDTKGEISGIGKKKLGGHGGKRKRQEMEDMAYYNKRMFDDNPQLLPEWFNDYEKTHNQRPKLVIKEERLAEKALFKEIDARPAKKVVEAKARKKRVAMGNLDNSIADQTDINDRSKRRMIEQLTPKKPGKERLVAKKGKVLVKSGHFRSQLFNCFGSTQIRVELELKYLGTCYLGRVTFSCLDGRITAK